jgi:hypothetical protein
MYIQCMNTKKRRPKPKIAEGQDTIIFSFKINRELIDAIPLPKGKYIRIALKRMYKADLPVF